MVKNHEKNLNEALNEVPEDNTADIENIDLTKADG